MESASLEKQISKVNMKLRARKDRDFIFISCRSQRLD